jgi:anti-sigma B factor antagonist
MRLSLTKAMSGDVAILKCQGRITLGEAAPLEDGIRSAVGEGAKGVVLNLAGVDYIDSAGIGSLVSGFTYTRNSGGNLVLVALTKRVSDLLRITKLYTVFGVFADVDAALTFLRAKDGAEEVDGQTSQSD